MIKRQVFFSFHYEQDVRRVAQIRNIGTIEGNSVVSDNDWETVKRGGDDAIKKWIDSNLQYRSCLVVLVGKHTSERKWIDYEIRQAWNKGMGVLGIYIHRIKDPLLCRMGYSGYSNMGRNPFDNICFENGSPLSSVVHCYNPDYNNAYGCIADNLETWVESAIGDR